MSVWIVRDPLFGDGGKAKIVDLLTDSGEVGAVARYQGGANAGHTMVVDGKKIIAHAIPSGVVRAQERPLMSVMGRGMVVSLPDVFREIGELEAQGIKVTPEILMMSEGMQLTLPYQRALENARETGKDSMATTGRAISQTYAFAALYQGIRAGDVRDLDYVRKRIQTPLSYANAIITQVFGGKPVTEEEVMAEVEAYRDQLMPFLGNEILFLNRLLGEGHVVLCEGAQSMMLDKDVGIYPNSTSSNPLPGAIQAGCGIDPRHITRDILVVKAYISRVGLGHLVAEMTQELGDLIREKGAEYGATTGKPRRIGWDDDTIARYAAMIGPGTELAITKADILTGISPLQICYEYVDRASGKTLDIFPTTVEELKRCRPRFETIGSWEEDITGMTKWKDLPKNAQRYLERIAKPYGRPIRFVGTGPGRDQIIDMNKQN